MPKRKGGKRKKKRTQWNDKKKLEEDQAPHSIIVSRGKIGHSARELVRELRLVFSPNTALKLKERKSNMLKDFLAICGTYNVSHLLTVTQSRSGFQGPNLRIARVGNGPTLTFHVEQYALMSHIREALLARRKKVVDTHAAFQTPPLVVLNNFDSTDEKRRHAKVVALTFQAMFPALNVKTLTLSSCKRVLLLHYNQDTDIIELRHYLISTVPAGASRVARKLLKIKATQDLHKKEDFGDLAENSGYATSDSEYDDDDAKVELPKPVFGSAASAKAAIKRMRNRQKAKEMAKDLAAVQKSLNIPQSEQDASSTASTSRKSVIKLTEIGPRMKLRLVKIQAGVFDGEVQYHAFEKRSEEEVAQQKKEHQEKAELKAKRREEQELNVKRKREAEAEKEQRQAAKRQRRAERRVKFEDSVKKGDDDKEDEGMEDEEEDESEIEDEEEEEEDMDE